MAKPESILRWRSVLICNKLIISKLIIVIPVTCNWKLVYRSLLTTYTLPYFKPGCPHQVAIGIDFNQIVSSGVFRAFIVGEG